MSGPHDPDLLERLVEGSLREEARKRVEAHLESCTACMSHVRFIRRVRTALAAGRAGDGLSAAEADALARRVMRAIDAPVPPIVSWRWPAWGAVGAVAALALWLSIAGMPGPRAPGFRAAEGVPAAAGAAALRRAEAAAIGDLSTTGFAGAGLAPQVVADFDSVADLARLTVGGAAGPAVRSAVRGGRRALVLTGLSGFADPVRVELSVPAGTGRVMAVSAWVWADADGAEVALEVTDAGGGVQRAEPGRRVMPGQWMLVTFSLPADGAPVAGLRFLVGGARAVAVDRVEVWRHGP
jgi:hypothetical protein